jgi:hypothetical protein
MRLYDHSEAAREALDGGLSPEHAYQSVSGYEFSANPSEDLTIYAPGFLATLPTLAASQADDLKLETGGRLRYWLARCGEADGETWQVHVERMKAGCWEPLVSYREAA